MDTRPLFFNSMRRILIAALSIGIPVILIKQKIYGSFLFTFSIPFLWQASVRGEGFGSLGLKAEKVFLSVIFGAITGLALGTAGGAILKLSGFSGYMLSPFSVLKLGFGDISMSFKLNRELGYYFLSHSNDIWGIGLYLLFCLCAVGLGEELFWRGFLQKELSRYMPVRGAILAGAFLFSAIHFYIFSIMPPLGAGLFLFLIFLAAVVWGYLTKHFGNIYAAALSHGITAFIIWKYYFYGF